MSFSISDRRLGPSGRSEQREWRCIIGHTLLRMIRWCIRLTRLTLVCEVIKYRLVQVRQNLKKRTFRVGGPQSPFSTSSSFILFFVLLPFFLNTKWKLPVSHRLMASSISVLGEPELVNLVVRALKRDYLLLNIFLHLRSETCKLDPVDDRGSAGEGASSAILFWGWSGGVSVWRVWLSSARWRLVSVESIKNYCQ